jgi:hypothetical protein
MPLAQIKGERAGPDLPIHVQEPPDRHGRLAPREAVGSRWFSHQEGEGSSQSAAQGSKDRRLVVRKSAGPQGEGGDEFLAQRIKFQGRSKLRRGGRKDSSRGVWGGVATQRIPGRAALRGAESLRQNVAGKGPSWPLANLAG